MINFITVEKVFVYLIALLPVLLVTGPFLPDLIVVLSSFFFLYIVFKDRKFYLLKNKYFLFFIFFWIYLILNSILSVNYLHSLKSSVPFIRFGIFFLFINYLLNKDYNLIKKLFIVFSFTLLCLHIDIIIQFIFGKNIIGLEPILKGRYSSFFGDESIVGSYISRTLPFYLALMALILKKDNKKLFLTLAVLILSLNSVILSGERMSLAILIFFFAIYFFSKFKYKLYFFIGILILFSINLKYNKTFVERFIQAPIDYQNKSVNKLLSYENVLPQNKEIFLNRKFTAYNVFYHSHFLSAYLMFKDKYIFGHGVNNFRLMCDDQKFLIHDKSCSTHPHNILLQILSETGFLGFIFLVIFLVYFYKKLFREIFLFKMEEYEFYLVAFFCVNFFPLFSSGSIFNNWFCLLLFLPLGFYVNYQYKNTNV